MPPPCADLIDLEESHFAMIADLARTIWREHYIKITGEAQVEYMLRGRYVPEKLRLYLGASDRWFKLLQIGTETVGYCSYSLQAPGVLKLEQLYLLAERRGQKLGGLMLSHIEAQARAHGRGTIVLTVNKHNTGSIAVYQKSGFTVREEAVFDIGGGHVMDDYVMEKRL